MKGDFTDFNNIDMEYKPEIQKQNNLNSDSDFSSFEKSSNS